MSEQIENKNNLIYGSKKKGRKAKDYPLNSLKDAIKIIRKIHELGGYANKSDLESALSIHGGWLAGNIASLKKYGLVEGHGQLILTERAKKIITPTYEGEDIEAKRETFLSIDLFNQIYSRFKGNYPEDKIFTNILLRNYGVKNEKEALRIINIIKETTSELSLQGDIEISEQVNDIQESPKLLAKKNIKQNIDKQFFLTIESLGVLEGISKAVFDQQMNAETVRFSLDELYTSSKDFPSLNSLIEFTKEQLENKEIDYKDVLKRYPSFRQRLVKDIGIQNELDGPQEDNAEG